MNDCSKKFFQDVVATCKYPYCSLTPIYDITLLADTGDTMILDNSDILKYYKGYINSNVQTRQDAINRAANYIDSIAFSWNAKKNQASNHKNRTK